jgi:type IV pilus assembly protein PilA
MNIKSKKGFTLVEIMIVVVIIILLTVMAIPAVQKVRETAQTKAITNNLRALASGAEKYFTEHDVTRVTRADLVGDGKYVKQLNPVAGENYPAMIIQGTSIEATGGAPGTISIEF